MTEVNKDNTITTDTTATTDIPTTDAVSTEPSVVETTVTETSSTNVMPLSEPVVTVAAEEVVANTATTESISPTHAPRHNSVLVQYGIAGLIILIMGAGLWYILETQGRVHTTVFSSLRTMVLGEKAAVIVNGEKVPLSAYEKSVAQLSSMATEQGMDPNDASLATQIKDQAIELLINTEVLRQAAVKAGLSVDDEEVNTRFDDIVTQLGSEEVLNTRLTEIGSSVTTLREDIRGELLIQKYLDTNVDVSGVNVTEADAKTQYDNLVAYYKAQATDSAPAVDIPTFEEAKDGLMAQIKTEKEQELIGEHIDKLRSEATIETII